MAPGAAARPFASLMLAWLRRLLRRSCDRARRPASPAGRWLPTAEYSARSGAAWRPVYSATVVERPQPVNLGRRPCDLAAQLATHFPETGVLALPGGRLYGAAGWVVSPDGVLLPEHSWFGRHVEEMELPAAWGPVRRVPGTLVSLASDWSHMNYGHYLLDGLARWHLFEAAGYSAEDVDAIYCPADNPARGRRLAERLGIPVDRCLFQPLPRGEGLQAGLLLAPTFPGLRRNYPDWIVAFLRRVVRPAAMSSRRLYTTRSQGRRRVVNEDELLPVLKRHSFEIYDPVGASDPPADFAAAEAVVGPHGSGLVDLAFCRPGTRVLEVLPSDHVYPYFCSLAQAAHLRYGYLVGPSLGQRPPVTRGSSHFDFRVDPGELDETIEATLEEEWPPRRAGSTSDRGAA